MAGDARWHSSKRFLSGAALAVIAGAALFTYVVAPWYYASPVPVQLVLKAPADTPLRLSWEGDPSTAVPFILRKSKDEIETCLWLAELPPRPSYQLAILFDAPLHGVLLSDLTLVDVRKFEAPILKLGADDMARQLQPAGIRLTSTGASVVLDSASAGSLSLPAPVPCTSRSRAGVFLLLWCLVTAVILLTGLIGWAFVREAGAVRSLADDLHPTGLPGHSLAPIWIAAGAGFVLHMGVTAGIPVIYNAFDPLAYFHKAVWLVERGTYITETPSWEMDRLPGYPLFLAACVKLFGYQLQLIVLTQGLLFALALTALAVSLRHWIRPLFSGAGILFVLASPVSLQHTLSIGTEGLFASCAILAMAAFFEHLGAPKRSSIAWLAVCGLAIAVATLIRPNGIVLLVMPLAACVPLAIRGALIRGSGLEKIRALFGNSWPYAIPAAFLIVVLGGWAIRNGRQHGLYAPSSMVGVSLVEGQLQAGTFDGRSLREDGLYEEFVRARQSEKYGYSGWHVRGSLGRALKQPGQSLPPGYIATLDQGMKQIAARSNALSPWQLRTAGLLRSLVWGLTLPASHSYTRNTIWSSPYFYGNHPDATAAWKRFCNEDAIARFGKPLPLLELENEEPKTDWAVDYFRWPDARHRWGYRVFLIASFVMFPLLLWRGPALFTAPMLVFLTNVALNTWLLNMQGRYIFPLEFAVVFQALIGLDLLFRGLLKRGGEVCNATAPSTGAIDQPDGPQPIRIAA